MMKAIVFAAMVALLVGLVGYGVHSFVDNTSKAITAKISSVR